MHPAVFFSVVFVVGLSLFPTQARAAATVPSILDAFTESLGNFVAIGVAIAVVVFMWGVVDAISYTGGVTDLGGGQKAKKGDQRIAAGKQRMFWGVIAIFILVSVWGIVALLQEVVGVESKSTCVYTHFGNGVSEAVKCF